MRNTKWTGLRLQRLFDKYNRLYFRGRLPVYRIKAGKARYGDSSSLARSKKTITIDIEDIERQHRTRPASTSDAEIRERLLMEMADAFGLFDKDSLHKGLSPKLRAWMRKGQERALQLEQQIVRIPART